MNRSERMAWTLAAVTMLIAETSWALANEATMPQSNAQDAVAPETIGTATEEADGTIVLNLRATGVGGAVGDGQFRYPKTTRNMRRSGRMSVRSRRAGR